MTTLSLPSMNTLFANDRPVGNAGKTASAGFGQVVTSAELLKGERTVAIEHNGSLYRLQETKLGKLILTK